MRHVRARTPVQWWWFMLLLLGGVGSVHTVAKDQPQWGQAWSRNMVSAELNLPSSFDPRTREQIKWSAPLGTESHSTPVVSQGRVLIGTNNGQPRDPKHQGDRGVLMCFSEVDGRLLWQLVVPKREEDRYFDWPNSGISSPATVEGDRVYLVSNRGVVLCLDLQGLSNGNDGPFVDEAAHAAPAGSTPVELGPLDADILWAFDLTKHAGIWSHDAAHSSILIRGPHLYLNTGTGVDNTHRRIRTPEAPSLIVLEKSTGRYLARDQEKIAPHIFHCTWSSPSSGRVGGRELIFFAGGNGVVYAFDPLPEQPGAEGLASLTKVWQFDIDPAAPKEEVHKYNSNRREGPSNIHGMPVFHQNRIYVAGGGDLWWGKNSATLKCIEASGQGDITSSGLLWTFPLERHVLSTPAVDGGLLFIADCGGNLHCLDARTGSPFWKHELGGDIWASPMVADGKVYLGNRRGQFAVLAAAKEKKLLSSIELRTPISATATIANGTLYVATMTELYAISTTSHSP